MPAAALKPYQAPRIARADFFRDDLRNKRVTWGALGAVVKMLRRPEKLVTLTLAGKPFLANDQNRQTFRAEAWTNTQLATILLFLLDQRTLAPALVSKSHWGIELETVLASKARRITRADLSIVVSRPDTSPQPSPLFPFYTAQVITPNDNSLAKFSDTLIPTSLVYHSAEAGDLNSAVYLHPHSEAQLAYHHYALARQANLEQNPALEASLISQAAGHLLKAADHDGPTDLGILLEAAELFLNSIYISVHLAQTTAQEYKPDRSLLKQGSTIMYKLGRGTRNRKLMATALQLLTQQKALADDGSEQEIIGARIETIEKEIRRMVHVTRESRADIWREALRR